MLTDQNDLYFKRIIDRSELKQGFTLPFNWDLTVAASVHINDFFVYNYININIHFDPSHNIWMHHVTSRTVRDSRLC